MKDQALQRVSDRISAHLSSAAKADASTHCVTEDIDEFQLSLDSVFYPANIDLLGEQNRVSRAELYAVRLKYLTIGLTRFGHEVSIDVGDLGSYHVNVPVSGHAVSLCGERRMIATPECGAVFTPHEHSLIPLWGADATQICIKIDRAGLESELAHILGHPSTSTSASISRWI